MEEKHCFVHDMLDVKVLVLYALAQLPEPAEDFSVLAEVCLVDDGLSYFDLGEALSSLCSTGHVCEDSRGAIALTEQGRLHGGLTQDSLAAPLRQKVNESVEARLRRSQREKLVQTEILAQEDDSFLVQLHLASPVGELMSLALPAQSRSQARLLETAMNDRAESLYARVLELLLVPSSIHTDPEKAVDK